MFLLFQTREDRAPSGGWWPSPKDAVCVMQGAGP